jgi:hypothetical protein
VCVQNFKYPLGGTLRFPDLCEHAGSGAEWADQNAGKEDEREEIARRHASVDNLVSPIPQHGRSGGEGEETDDGNEHRHGAGPSHRQSQGLFDLRGKSVFFTL